MIWLCINHNFVTFIVWKISMKSWFRCDYGKQQTGVQNEIVILLYFYQSAERNRDFVMLFLKIQQN